MSEGAACPVLCAANYISHVLLTYLRTSSSHEELAPKGRILWPLECAKPFCYALPCQTIPIELHTHTHTQTPCHADLKVVQYLKVVFPVLSRCKRTLAPLLSKDVPGPTAMLAIWLASCTTVLMPDRPWLNAGQGLSVLLPP